MEERISAAEDRIQVIDSSIKENINSAMFLA